MKAILATLAILTATSPAFAVCESVFAFTPRCGNEAFIETQCWPPSIPSYGRRFEGYALHTDGTLQHIKVTCGGAYLTGYRHISCPNEQLAAAATEATCCGTTAAQIAANCPDMSVFFTDFMP